MEGEVLGPSRSSEMASPGLRSPWKSKTTLALVAMVTEDVNLHWRGFACARVLGWGGARGRPPTLPLTPHAA